MLSTRWIHCRILHYHTMHTMYLPFAGTADNFNTEYTEHFHIFLAEDAYASTNFKDKFPQMTLWLEYKELIMHHEKYICHHLN